MGLGVAIVALGAASVSAALAGTPPRSQAETDAVRSQRVVFATSAQGRRIAVVTRGDPDARTRILVVGCIHGDEPAGIAIARRVETAAVAREADISVIADANPDGVAADRRTNAHLVDLNRNFPWHWRRQESPGQRHYSGPRPLSEPESRALARLITRLRPQITIWFHQPFGVVDESGGSLAVERRYANLVGLPLRRLPRYGGGVTDWQNANFPGSTAFVVELPAGPLAPARAARFAAAILALAQQPPGRDPD